MFVLSLGVALWSAVHFLPSVSPRLREDIIEGIGPKAYRGGFSALMVLALVLMIIGYRSADFWPVYDPPSWGVHLNNLAVLIAVYLLGAAGAKGWLATKIRHPMLTAVIVWAAAHLLVNGDEASLLLFGGMLLWAVAEIFMINRRTAGWAAPKWGGPVAEAKLIGLSLVFYAVIAFAHGWLLGVNPFGG
ncbi:MAG: NnrU family protein [Pseudomonadota bacterium]